MKGFSKLNGVEIESKKRTEYIIKQKNNNKDYLNSIHTNKFCCTSTAHHFLLKKVDGWMDRQTDNVII